MIQELKSNAFRLVKELPLFLKSHARALGLYFLLLAAFVVWFWPQDPALSKHITNNDTLEWREFARKLSFWGDFPTGSIIIAILLWTLGVFGRQRHWRNAALACLLASMIAGMTTNVFRLTLGRPRPSADLPNRFYGLRAGHHYHGFPSGHCATAFGTATALAVALPPVGIPAVVGATGVAWSRMYLKQHYLTDVLVGSSFGILAGLALGFAARRLNRESGV